MKVHNVFIVLALCLCVVLGAMYNDMVVMDVCEKQGVYVPMTSPGKLLECYTVEHVDEKHTSRD